MLNRRTFLKTSAAVLPVTAALNALDPTHALGTQETAAAATGPTSQLTPGAPGSG
jgi:hypothetical protein